MKLAANDKIYSHIKTRKLVYSANYLTRFDMRKTLVTNRLMTETAVRRFLQNRCSLKFSNIHRKTTVLESLLNKVAGLKACNFIRKRLQRKCFPLNIVNFLRTAFFVVEHFWWLLL